MAELTTFISWLPDAALRETVSLATEVMNAVDATAVRKLALGIGRSLNVLDPRTLRLLDAAEILMALRSCEVGESGSDESEGSWRFWDVMRRFDHHPLASWACAYLLTIEENKVLFTEFFEGYVSSFDDLDPILRALDTARATRRETLFNWLIERSVSWGPGRTPPLVKMAFEMGARGPSQHVSALCSDFLRVDAAAAAVPGSGATTQLVLYWGSQKDGVLSRRRRLALRSDWWLAQFSGINGDFTTFSTPLNAERFTAGLRRKVGRRPALAERDALAIGAWLRRAEASDETAGYLVYTTEAARAWLTSSLDLRAA